ncbi:MAG: right-handed parallel beta-helix repeat-containing protein [Clostridia bacterium]|nr:right-handed parallel beta-helix repeat-containing protein [Clostridia bacterium]
MNIFINNKCTDHTSAIQNAIDDCFRSGGGRVTVEDGEYHIKGIRLRSNVTLFLKGGVRLIATRDIEAYNILAEDTLEPLPECEKTDVLWAKANPARNNDFIRKCGSRWTNAIIRLVYAENASIIAEEGAVIDGCNSYDEIGEEHYRGVHGISMYHCKNLEFRGYTIKDTGNWAHCGYFCENLTFSGITILAGHDGVHTGSCDNILVENCKMYTGDDCVAGFDIRGLTVRNCLFNTACSSFRLGGTDVLIENCTLVGPPRFCFRGSLTKEEKRDGAPSQSGRKTTLSAFTYYSDFTLTVRNAPGNILMRNCSFENLERFLHFNYSGNEVWQSNRALESISFENVSATNVGMSLCAYGDAENPVTISIKDCSFTFATEQTELIRTANFKEITLENVSAGNVSGKALRSWGGNGKLKAVGICGFEDSITEATEPFHTKAI